MSTSPSWFDQEKFSRLVKKVGTKTTTQAVPKVTAKDESAPTLKPPPGTFPVIKIPIPEGNTKTAPLTISKLVEPPKASEPPQTPTPELPKLPQAPSKPLAPPEKAALVSARNKTTSLPSRRTSLLPGRKTSSLPARKTSSMLAPSKTSSLPVLKPVFEYEKPSVPPKVAPPPLPIPLPSQAVGAVSSPNVQEKVPASSMVPTEKLSKLGSEEVKQLRGEMEAAQEKLKSLGEELSRVEKERDKARNENALVRSQLLQMEEISKERGALSAQVDELSRAVQERDQLRNENSVLLEQLRQAEEAGGDRQALSEQLEGLSAAVEERDQARREYAKLREQFESVRQEHNRFGEGKNKFGQAEAASDGELQTLRQQIADRDEELATLKVKTIGMEDVIETLKDELNTLQEQVHQMKEETSAAQQGLALSQKALQETRDALREASEGSSMSKTNLEDLKNERSTLVQQNMFLQAQNDQISRELSAAKSKLAARG